MRGENHLRHYVEALKGAGIRVSLFIEPDARRSQASARLGAQVVELHTGAYCERALADDAAGMARELARIEARCRAAAAAGLEVHAGHGLTFNTVAAVARIPEIVELNIGHFLVGEAIFTGLGPAIARMRALMDEARKPARVAAMILGIGNDVIDIRRIEKAIERYGERFLNRIFTTPSAPGQTESRAVPRPMPSGSRPRRRAQRRWERG